MHGKYQEMKFGACIYFAVFASSAFGQSGALSGVVVGDRGVVEQAGVVLSPHPTAIDGAGPKLWVGRQVTGKDGAFRIENVPTGTYQLCIQPPPAVDLLSTCPTPDDLMVISVLGNRSLGAVKLKNAYRIKARIDDAVGALSKNEGVTSGAYLLLGAWIGRHFSHFRVTGQDATGRDLECLVPFDTALRIAALAGRYQVIGPAGESIAAGKQFSSDMEVKTGASSPALLRFQVVGFK